MKQTFKKSLSIILAAAIMLCSAPLTGLLDLELPDFGGFKKLADSVSDFFDGFSTKAEAATYGKCGDNLTWNLDKSTGLLTISGSGKMYDYSFDSNPMWRYSTNYIQRIIVGDEVTYISDYAFYDCGMASDISIGTAVTEIGDHSFSSCSKVSDITIPNSVKTIGDYAFVSCSNLTKILIGNGVESIGEYAFLYCDSLEEITIPDNVTEIGESAFWGCENLSSVTIGEGLTEIKKRTFDSCPILETVIIGNNVTRIGEYSFGYCRKLTDVTIGNSVTDIAEGAFTNCFNLTDISFPESVATISDFAFYKCTSLTNLVLENGIKSIGMFAFRYCDSITNIEISESLSNIGDGAFDCCENLSNISVDKNNSNFYNDNYGVLFQRNKYGFESVYLIQYPIGNPRTVYSIPNGTREIDVRAFAGCTKLTKITIPDSVNGYFGGLNDAYSLTAYSVSGGNTCYSNDSNGVLFNKDKTVLIQYPIGKTQESYTVPDTVTRIYGGAFSGCKNLTRITIPEGVSNIEHDTFHSCSKLTSITVSNSLTNVGSGAFHECIALTDVYYNGTEVQWNAISIGLNNAPLLNATIHYNYVPEGGGEVTPPAEDDYSTQNIKVMSYNVYVKDGNVKGITNGKTYDCSYETRTRYIVQSINENMPDSIGLQELTSEMRTFLETFEDLNGGILSVNYAGVGEYRSKSGNNNEASLIYYNKNKFTLKESGTFWLSESGEKYSKHTGSEYPRICTYALLENKATGQQYLHVNTHLEHDHSSKDGGSNNAAIFSSEKIIDFVNKKFPNIPVVITGDFNQKKDSAPYNNFINAGYTDTRDVYSGNLNTYINSYNQGEDKKVYGAKVIDHVLVNEYFNNGIESYTVYNEDYSNSDKYGNLALDYPYPSDHHPIVVELKATYSGDIISSKEIKFGENKSVEVVLDDDWFEKSNTEYNHALAQFCADYVMMGYCYNDDTVKGYLSQMGFDTVDSCMNAGRDEVNYFIASKDITVNGETETLVFAAFIGSHEKQWYSNFDPYGTERDNWKKRNAPYSDSNEKGKVHLGFADAREYVYAKLKKFIADNNIDKENMKLLISGHSRGAATANLLAAKLIDETYANSSTALVNRNSIYTYTFATPNVASTQKNVFDSKYKCIFNIVNPEDFVTKVLPNSWGYYRYGKTYVLPSQTNDKNWKSYLKAMNKCFAQYKFGEIYDPYNDGEKTTYKIVEKFTKNINNLDEFYEKDIWAYNISGMIPQFMKPYDFFKDSLLGYLSEQNKAGGLNLAVAILLYGKTVYQDMIAYFFNPDLLLDASLNPGVDPGGKFKQAHQMETYCAYMNAMTSSQIKQTRLYYENTVNCPVDIEIYDNATNELVGKITNNVVDETVAAGENAIVMDVEGDSKSFYLPSNGDYRIVLTGNDNGTMDYSVSSIDSDTGETERLNFFDVEIEKGVSMEGKIKAEEFVLEEYTLNHEENGVIEPTEKLEGDELRDISVSITTEGAGYADRNIAVTSGDYITVTATANENNNFIGWYENGVLVSNDAEYSFVAKENRNLVAKFTNNYAIEWNVDGEITTTYCEAGSAITTLENPAKSGYKFLGWTPAIPDVMPAENLSFTAVFELLFKSEIRKPSITTISYGDSIILHADISGELPAGYYVEWTASNENFEWTANGATCEISPEKSGDTTFTATIYDADGNPVSVDEQTMTSKAGFFQKIIAFFKKLFGLTKTIPNVFKF